MFALGTLHFTHAYNRKRLYTESYCSEYMLYLIGIINIAIRTVAADARNYFTKSLSGIRFAENITPTGFIG